MEPYFFQENIPAQTGRFILDEETSKHCVQVLRMRENEKIRLTNGEGTLALAKIIQTHKKHCQVEILELKKENKPGNSGFCLAIAFTKSKSRNEWLLEKLTEIGTESIFPIICEHSERDKFNEDRYRKVLIAALLQSQQTRLPKLHAPVKLSHFLSEQGATFNGNKLIAYCLDDIAERHPIMAGLEKGQKTLMLIGPEGDFSGREIEQCIQKGFQPVHLGANRLRTETAALYACTAYHAFQES